MNCKNCGNLLVPGEKKCSVCGAIVETPVVSANQGVNQGVGVPSFGGEQNSQGSLTSGTTVPNSSSQMSSNQTSANAIPSLNSSLLDFPKDNSALSNQSLENGVNNGLSSSQTNSLNSNGTNFQAGASIPNSNVNMNQAMNQEVSPVVPNASQVGVNNHMSEPLANGLQSGQAVNNSVQNINPSVQNEGVQNQVLTGNTQGMDNLVAMANSSQSNNVSTVDTSNSTQAPLEEVKETPKKKGKLTLIVAVVLIIAVVAFFLFQYLSLTKEANKIKNNNTSNSQLNNNSKNIVSEDAYETIAHQDANYVEYNFDFNSISEIYEHEYAIGKHKVKIAITSDKSGVISINDLKQEITYPIIKIYHLLKADVLFIENQLFTNDSDLYVYTGKSIDNMKNQLKGSQSFEGIVVKDNVLEFTGKYWKENNVFNGDTSFNLCQDGYVNVGEDFVIENTYTFDIQDSAYSSDKLKVTLKKTVKQLYDDVCRGAGTITEPTTEGIPQTTNPVGETNPEVPGENQTPIIETIPQP